MDNPAKLLAYLEMPYEKAARDAALPLRSIVLEGLRFPGSYWVDLALGWLEDGYPVDAEIAETLDNVVKNTKAFPQATRHKAFSIGRRFDRQINASGI